MSACGLEISGWGMFYSRARVERTARSMRLAIVDWKIMRRDPEATDVGQFAAEAYSVDWFRGGRSLCGAFLMANRGNRMLDRRFVKEVAVYFGILDCKGRFGGRGRNARDFEIVSRSHGQRMARIRLE